jgi:hypothetical protein
VKVFAVAARTTHRNVVVASVPPPVAPKNQGQCGETVVHGPGEPVPGPIEFRTSRRGVAARLLTVL